MKLATVILCSVLLVLGQAWATPVASGSSCARMSSMPCCQNGLMSCCAAKSAGSTKPVAPVPLRSGLAAPFLMLLALVATWQFFNFEERRTQAVRLIPIYATSSPLYARDCARLI